MVLRKCDLSRCDLILCVFKVCLHPRGLLESDLPLSVELPQPWELLQEYTNLCHFVFCVRNENVCTEALALKEINRIDDCASLLFDALLKHGVFFVVQNEVCFTESWKEEVLRVQEVPISIALQSPLLCNNRDAFLKCV